MRIVSNLKMEIYSKSNVVVIYVQGREIRSLYTDNDNLRIFVIDMDRVDHVSTGEIWEPEQLELRDLKVSFTTAVALEWLISKL